MYRRLFPSLTAAAAALLLVSSSAWSVEPTESWTAKTPEKSEEEVDEATETDRREEAVKDIETVEPENTTASDGQSRVDPNRDAADRCLVRVVEAVLQVDKMSKDAELTVDSKAGVIMLEGELPTQEAVDHVQQLLADLEGVNRVDTSRITQPEAAARVAQ